MDVDAFVAQCQRACERLMGLQVRKSKVKAYHQSKWASIVGQEARRKKPPGFVTVGLYQPSKHLATFNLDCAYPHSVLVHELFGHGIFYEYSSKVGRADFDLKEGHAQWAEMVFAPLVGYEREWERSQRDPDPDYARAFKKMKRIHDAYGHLGVMHEAGLPLHFTPYNTALLLKNLYPDTQAVRMAFQTGSRNLCIVSRAAYGPRAPGIEIEEITDSEFSRRWCQGDSRLRKVVQDTRALIGEDRQSLLLRLS